MLKSETELLNELCKNLFDLLHLNKIEIESLKKDIERKTMRINNDTIESVKLNSKIISLKEAVRKLEANRCGL